jgi:beta-lactamase class D
MRETLLLLTALLFPALAAAEDRDIARLFQNRDAVGTMVIAPLKDSQTFIHNEARAHSRYTVASTFKILNTLISLEEGTVSGKGDIFKWDGRVHDIANWNRDHTLESAFRMSCVWCYQELARRNGLETYRRYFGKFEYGHLREPLAETEFWLDGSLTISASEQIAFLKQLYLRQLPFSTRAYDILREIMLAEEKPGYRLYAKSGYAPPIGWYVGYVETGGDVWFFAMNMDINESGRLPVRLELTHAALQAKGIIQ